MKWLQKILVILWRIYFSLLAFLATIMVAIPLIALTFKKSWYPMAWQIMRFWSKITFFGMGMNYKILTKMDYPKEPFVFVSNHSSLMDVMLTMILLPKHPACFVGKAELGRYPIFGYIYRQTSILVDRKNEQSRKAVFRQAIDRAQSNQSIIIYPEGGVPDDESIRLDTFKDGAFAIAIASQMPILVHTFVGIKQMFPYSWVRGYPGKVKVYVEAMVNTKDLRLRDKDIIKDEIYQIIDKRLRASE